MFFLTPILSWLGSLLGGPFARAAVDAYSKRLDAQNSSERIAAELAGRELEVQRSELEAQAKLRTAMIGHWYEPTQLLGYIMVIYVGKVIIWDKVLMLGSTDPITGAVGEWAAAIILFLIGKRGIENVARIIRR